MTVKISGTFENSESLNTFPTLLLLQQGSLISPQKLAAGFGAVGGVAFQTLAFDLGLRVLAAGALGMAGLAEIPFPQP